MAYLDNAATTYPKPECVYAAMDMFYRTCGASVGRGISSEAESAANMIGETRSLIRSLLNCPNKEVIFTPSATIALNMIIQGMISRGMKHFYISPLEHNAVVRTLHHFEENGSIQIHPLIMNDNFDYDLERIHYQFQNIKPDMLIISHASNVTGVVSPIESIFRIAKKFDSVTLVDMAQTAGLIDCDLGSNDFDFAVFAGHKTLYGPTGISGFVMKPDIHLPPVLFGGTGFESANLKMPEQLPEKYEMGTFNCVGIAGLQASLRWCLEQGVAHLYEHEVSNRARLLNILNKFDFIKVVGNNPAHKYVGIVSFLIDGISSDSAGEIFKRLGITVRTGLQCAPLAHKFIGTYPAGTIRVSTSYYTSDDDFNEFEQALEYIEENL